MDYFPLCGSIVLVGLGLLGMLMPGKAAALVGIRPEGPIGVSEIRVTYGAMFLGMGVAALYFQAEVIYLMLGATSLLAAIVRAISIVVDDSGTGKNFGAIAFEAALGLLFLSVLV